MDEQPEWGIKFSQLFVIPQRVILGIMGFLALVNAYTMRITLSLVITQLVVKVNHTGEENGDMAVCTGTDILDTETSLGGSLEWSQELQGFVLSSFYIGYLLTHIPGGIIADHFGGKWVLGLGIFSTAIFTLFTPMTINGGGAVGLIILRILMGLGEGMTYPAMSVLLAHWVPARERGKIGALVLGGGQMGTIVGNLATGIILHHYEWPMVFYIFSIIAFVWFFIFVFLCFSDPESHPFIKRSEKEYLKNEIGAIGHYTDRPPTPWLAIINNAAMLALISAQIGHDWAFYIIVTDLPKYMSDVMNFSIKKNGMFTSLPPLMMWITSLTSGVIVDYLITSNYMSITNTRKTMTGIAAFGPAIFMVAASYAGCNRLAVVILFTICMGLMGAFYAGMQLSPLDMSPNYAGSIMAITNGIGSITGILAPYFVGVMTPHATLLEWRVVLWVAFLVLSVTAVIYCVWASGDVQPFNNPVSKESNPGGNEDKSKQKPKTKPEDKK